MPFGTTLRWKFEEQEAQLLLRWPTHGAKSIYFEVNGQGVKVDVRWQA